MKPEATFKQRNKLALSSPNNHRKSGQQPRKLDSHERRLLRAKREGLNVLFILNSAEHSTPTISGKVIDFDKFSIVVQDNNGLEQVLFKHGVSHFTLPKATA